MITIQISEYTESCLKLLATRYVHPGQPPISTAKVIEDLVDNKIREVYPQEYKTTGFDRQ